MNRLAILIFAGSAVAILLYTLRSGESNTDYAKTLLQERQEKDLYMKTGQDSPFAGANQQFQGLKYFPPDPKYKIEAILEPIKAVKMRVLPTSDGLEKKYLEFGYAKFELDAIPNRLLILEVVDPGPNRGTLYLAFADETSALETYGAGRYLDIKKIPGASSIVLDFNKAYNPYCAYSDIFSCPFPPKENILKVAIKAGEKTYH